MREKYRVYGYDEVITPQVFDVELWKRSGHWDNYRDDMFFADSYDEVEQRSASVKPMNCPCHVQVYNQGLHSYRDLPIRLSEFGTQHLHRDLTVVLQVLGEIDRCHAAATEFPLDGVAVGECGGEAGEDVSHYSPLRPHQLLELWVVAEGLEFGVPMKPDAVWKTLIESPTLQFDRLLCGDGVVRFVFCSSSHNDH